MAVGPQTLLFTLRAQDEASRVLQGAGLAWASLGFAVGAATAAAVKANVEFSRTLVQMQTLAGVASGDIAGVTEALKDMAVETGRAPQDLANAMYYVSSSGFQTKEALEVVRASAQGAAIGLGDTKTVADAVTSAMNAYGHQNLSAADAVGQLTEAVKLGKGEADQIASAIGRVIGVSAQMGVSFKDVTGATAAMTTTGLTAAQSVTAIRQTLLAMYAPTMQARRVLQSLGVDYHDLQKVFQEKGFLAGIENLKAVTGTAVNLRMVLGDKEAVNAIFGLLGANLEHTKQIMADMANSGAPTLREAFATAAKSAAFSWDQGMALIKVAMLDFGNAIMPLVINALHLMIEAFYAVRGVIREVTDLWDHHRGAVIAVTTAITGLLVMRVLPGLMINTAAAIATATIRLVSLTTAIEGLTIAKVVSSFSGLATAIALVGRAAAAAIPEVVAFTAALLTNPIVLLIAALVAVGVALYEFMTHMFETSDGIVSGWQIIQATWAGAVAFTQVVWSEISGAVEVAARTILAICTLGLSEAAIAIYNHWDEIKAATEAAWPAIVAAVQTGLLAIVAAIPLVGPAVGLIVSYWDQIVSATNRAWDGVVSAVKNHIYEILAAVPLVGAAVAGAYAVAHAMQPAAQAASQAYHSTLANQYDPANAGYVTGLKGRIDAYKAQANLPKLTPPPSGVGDYSPAHGGRGGKAGAGGETEEEKEAKSVERTIEALKVQAAAYTETADNHAYLDSIRQAGLATQAKEYQSLQSALGITDKQAASNTHLANIKKVATAVQTKLNAEHDKYLADAQLDIDVQSRLVSAYAQGARTAAIQTAEINAYTDALKKNKTEAQAVEAAQAAGRDTAAKFDTKAAEASIDNARAFNDQMLAIQDQAKAYDMDARSAAVFLAGQEATRKALRDGIPDIAAYVAQQQNLAAANFDLANHQLTASQGVTKFMDEMKANAITTGTVVYNALKSVYDSLSSALWGFVSGQKGAWRQMASDIVNSIGKMIAQMLVMKAVMASLKFLGFATGGVPGGDPIVDAAAMGQVYGAQRFAKGQSFTNTVVDAMTAFLYHEDGRKKLGIMGEAGPEAIMPLLKTGQAMAVAAYTEQGTRRALELTRGPDGALGVKWPKQFASGDVFGGRMPHRMASTMGGGGGSGGVSIQMGDFVLNYTPTGDQQYDQKHIKEVRKMVETAIDERIGLAVRRINKPGGQQKSFGMN
jgi:TP901 family phage tail tape measure protein/lambda family phage tail tape measure protein